MKNLKGCFLHTTDHWSTPKQLYDYYMSKGYIDPCPLYSKVDCLKLNYFNCNLFINPPYSDMENFSKWIFRQVVSNNCNVDLLVPARTDTRWFHLLMELHPDITFIKGRLKFGDSKYGAPFPSIILHFNSASLD